MTINATTTLEKRLLSMLAFTQRDVSEMHLAVKILQTAGLIDEDQYSDACNLVSCARPQVETIEKREAAILAELVRDKS